MRPLKSIGIVLGVLLLSCILLIGSGTTANASSPTCYGDYCSNQDPAATHCDSGAWTQRYVDVYYARVVPWRKTTYAGRLELRASNTCGTQWARFATAMDDIPYAIWVDQDGTDYRTDFQNTPAGKDSWSNQIYSPSHCVTAWISFYDEDSFQQFI